MQNGRDDWESRCARLRGGYSARHEAEAILVCSIGKVKGTPAAATAFRRRLAALLCAMTVFLAPICAQTPGEAQPTFKTSVRNVVIDASVDDKSGHPILDLSKDDFTITENGRVQRIVSFEAPAVHSAPSGGPIVRSASDLKNIGDVPVCILVLDEVNTPFADMALARNAMDRYLRAQPEEVEQPTALYFMDGQRLQVVQDFTQRRSVLEEALAKHFPSYPWQLTYNSGDMAAFDRMAQSLTALIQITEATGGVRGRKNVIWVGKGFPSLDVSQADRRTARTLDLALKKTTLAMLQSRVTLFAIDPAILDPTPIIDDETSSTIAAGDLNGTGIAFAGAIQFPSLAASTGGRAFSRSNDVEGEIATSIRDAANYYELSYVPDGDSDDPAAYRKIRVVVHRPGVTVTARDGYFPSPDGQPETNIQSNLVDSVKFDLSTASLSNLTYSALTVKTQRVSAGEYAVSIDLDDLSWREYPKGRVAEVSVIALGFSAKNKPLVKSASEHTASTAGDTTHAHGSVTFRVPLTLPAKTTRVRFVVRDVSNGKIGSADVSVR